MTDRSLKDQLQSWKKDQTASTAKAAEAAAQQARARAPRTSAKKKAPAGRPPDVIRRDAPPDPRTAPPPAPPPKTDRQLLEEAANAVTAGAVLEKFAALPEGQKKPQLPTGAVLDDAALFARFTDGAKPLAQPETKQRAQKKP